MIDKRVKPDIVMAEIGLTTYQAAAAMRRLTNALPTVAQVMKNFALQARNARGRLK